MTTERLKQIAGHLASKLSPSTAGIPHPLDPLTTEEIERAVAVVRKDHPHLFFNAVTLWEPRKKEMLAWVANPESAPRPARRADVVAIGQGSKVYDGVVDLDKGELSSWELTEGVQPLVSHAPRHIRECI